MMQPPTRYPGYFPYRRYGANPHRRRRRLRHVVRRALQAHDFWCWFYGAVVLCTLIVLEVMRNAR